MILTEEQRAAIKLAMKYIARWPFAYKELHARGVLQAMIDSSEHIREPPKMVGFDLEKARASIAHYRIENPSNVDTESALKELVDQANLAEDALAEIERLQGFETAARDLNNDLIRIAGERDELAARIQELEDALVKERTGAIRCESYNHCEGMYEIDLPNAIIRAQTELQAEGKIGPDARPKCDHAWQAAIEERGYQTCLKCGECRNIEDIPRTAPAWPITEERKAALWHAINVLKENDIMEEPEEHLWDEEVTVLQAMLTEAGQE